tara:strand:- start:446 stop:1237 length:792 start_codon:yes stop_codon:yes gene_type:complete
MATVNLGKIKLKWRGTWSSGGSYTADDVVEYTDGSVTSSFIAVAASSNQAPSSSGTVNTSYWNLLAKGQATSPTTTQGDLIVRGASADQRLAIGSAGQALKVNSSGNGLEYGSAAVIKKIHSFEYATRVNASNSAGNKFTWTSSFVPLDPVNNSFWICGSVPVNLAGNDYCAFGLRIEKSGGGVTDFNGYGVQYNDLYQGHMGFYGYNFTTSSSFSGAGTYTIFHREFTNNSNPDAYAPNSADDSRLNAQTRGYLQIIEYKNA